MLLKKWIQKIDLVRALYIVLFFEFINVAYYIFYFSKNNYLPAPFIADKNDTFMDFYSPLFWVIKDGFYTSFNSVYPALNFYFLKIFSLGIPPDQVSNPFELRNNFPTLGLLITSLYVLIIFIVINIGEWRRIHACNKGLIFLACTLSVPVLFGLERANMIFLALLFFALYLGTSNPWLRAIYFGLLVNIKPYFGVLLLQYINVHHTNRVELIRLIILAATIFFGLGIFAGINFIDFFKAYLLFSKNTTLSVEGVVALPHSIAALSTIKALINFSGGSSYTFWFSLLKLINYISVLILVYVIIFKKLTSLESLIAIIAILVNFSISTGGYILIIYILLIPYLLQSNEYKKLLIFIILIYSFPFDFINFLEIHSTYEYSYIGGNVFISAPSFFLSIGSILRPLFNFLFMFFFLIHLFRKYPKISSNKSHSVCAN